jgi:hypothetical protein
MRGMKALLVAVILSLTAAGCVSMPSGGPVLPFPVTQRASGQAQPYLLQIVPPSPGQGWDPVQIVEGFLAASASFAGQHQVARDYLTPQASHDWKPDWSAVVFTNGPVVTAPKVTNPRRASQGTASVTIGGPIQATLSSKGTYAVAAPLSADTFQYDLVMYNGQWRISNLHHHPLLLTTTEFAADYQLRNLYFFAQTSNSVLVPDPVYVPLQATQADLMNELVQDLITQPPDWLNGATHTEFPKGTSLVGNVTVDGGTASVTLGGAATRVSDAVKEEQISSQLWWTLDGAGQGQQQVQSIALYIGDKAFVPPGAQGQGNAVQSQVRYKPVNINNPSGGVLYYLGTGGQLMKVTGSAGKPGKPVKVARIGTGYTGLAVSPNGAYVAALRGGNIYTGYTSGVEAGRLISRTAGGSFTSLSWDRDDNLWAADSAGVVTLSATAKPVDTPATVAILNQNGSNACGDQPCDVTAVRVAPDGVRIALVFDGKLAFGAIVMADQSAAVQASLAASSIQLSRFVVSPPSGKAFKALSWYGAEDVIALTEPGDTLTEYPVNGGTPTSSQGPPGMKSVAAYFDGKTGGLVAGFDHDTMNVDTSISGAWSSLDYHGQLPVYPG